MVFPKNKGNAIVNLNTSEFINKIKNLFYNRKQRVFIFEICKLSWEYFANNTFRKIPNLLFKKFTQQFCSSKVQIRKFSWEYLQISFFKNSQIRFCFENRPTFKIKAIKSREICYLKYQIHSAHENICKWLISKNSAWFSKNSQTDFCFET